MKYVTMAFQVQTSPPNLNHEAGIMYYGYMRKYSEGFTLIELLVVIVIISVLAGLVVSNFVGVRLRGRDAQRKSDLRQIQSALELYRADNGYYSPTLASCGSEFQGTGANPPVYMRKIPCDPINDTNYVYTAAPSGCSTNCIAYTIYACLENSSDQDRDADDGQVGDLCAGTGVVSHTITNP